MAFFAGDRRIASRLWFLFLLAVPAVVCAWLAVGSLRVEGREWTDLTGSFRVEAEMQKVDGGKVKLKRTDGRVITVPIDKLSRRDQLYIKLTQSKLASRSADSPKAVPAKSDTPDEPTVPDEDRQRAKQLIDEAFALLKLDREGNAPVVSNKLQEASRLDPTSLRAEFIRGLLNLLVARNATVAEKNFKECQKRAPKNAAVLNNLALTNVRLQRYDDALDLWEESMELAPGLFVISHNLGRLMKVNNDERIRMSKRDTERCADLYATAITSKNFPASKPQYGWMLMDFIELDDDDVAKGDAAADVPQNIVSGGTGFVVKGDYILTNKHVVGDAKTVKVRPADGQGSDLRDGTVVAVADDVDLAIVRCEGLNLVPVEIASAAPRRGSDIMVLGFPQFDQLGATLKSTRGAVTSLPGPATENMMLVDAEMNSGNSGGPMANKQGQVVAVATAVFKPIGGTGGRYGAGIPIAQHTSFLAKHIPDGVTQVEPGAELNWPDVDSKVSRSTVLILIEGDADDATQGSTLADGYGIPLLDPTCPACNGTKYLRRGVKCHFCRATGIDLAVVKAVIEDLKEAEGRR